MDRDRSRRQPMGLNHRNPEEIHSICQNTGKCPSAADCPANSAVRRINQAYGCQHRASHLAEYGCATVASRFRVRNHPKRRRGRVPIGRPATGERAGTGYRKTSRSRPRGSGECQYQAGQSTEDTYRLGARDKGNGFARKPQCSTASRCLWPKTRGFLRLSGCQTRAKPQPAYCAAFLHVLESRLLVMENQAP